MRKSSRKKIRTIVMSGSPFDTLPREIAWNVFSFLPAKALLRIQAVCKQWNDIAHQDGLWKEKFFNSFFHWYDEIAFRRMPGSPWRDRFWRCYHLHQNWREARHSPPTNRTYLRTIRQLQVTDNFLGLTCGNVIEVLDPITHAEKFRIKPSKNLRDTGPVLKGFYIYKSILVCAAGTAWSQINMYNLESGRVMCGWTAGDSPIETLALNDTTMVTGSRKCVVWDLHTRKALQMFSEQQRGIVNCLQFDDKMLACSHKGKKVRIWDIVSGKRIFTLQGHQHLVHCLQYNDSILVTGSKDKTLRVWDKRKGFSSMATLRGHTESVRALCLDNWKVISGSKDKDVRIWDVSGATTPPSPYQHPLWEENVGDYLNFDDVMSSNSLHDPDSFTPSPSSLRIQRASPIPLRSVCRISGSEAIFSLAASASRLYVGTCCLKAYDFDKPEEKSPGIAVYIDRLRNILNEKSTNVKRW